MSAARRGISDLDIDRARSDGSAFIQQNGAVVHLLETEPGRYFYVVEDAERDLIITVSDRRVRRHEIERLTVKYGWEPL